MQDLSHQQIEGLHCSMLLPCLYEGAEHPRKEACASPQISRMLHKLWSSGSICQAWCLLLCFLLTNGCQCMGSYQEGLEMSSPLHIFWDSQINANIRHRESFNVPDSKDTWTGKNLITRKCSSSNVSFVPAHQEGHRLRCEVYLFRLQFGLCQCHSPETIAQQRYVWSFTSSQFFSQKESRILELSESISWFGQVTPYKWKSMAFKQTITNCYSD